MTAYTKGADALAHHPVLVRPILPHRDRVLDMQFVRVAVEEAAGGVAAEFVHGREDRADDELIDGVERDGANAEGYDSQRSENGLHGVRCRWGAVGGGL